MSDRINGLTKKEREKAKTLSYKLINGFDWERTPQGIKYWISVFKQLEILGYGKKPKYYE